MTGLENKLRGLVERHYREICLSALLILSALTRMLLAPAEHSGDYIFCIEPWVETYRELGVVQGLATPITNYYIPYNILLAVISLFPMRPWVLVSLTSCVFEYLMVYYVYRILLWLGGEKRAWRAVCTAVFLLFLPPVMLNGAFWKQCDAIYSAFAVMAFYYLLRDSYYRAFLFLSIAFVFKLQTILILPVFLIAWFCGKKYSLLYWLRLPVTFLEAGLPAIMAGRPAREVYAVYLGQSNEYRYMFLNTGNLYRLLRGDYELLNGAAILSTMAVFVLLFCYILPRREAVNGERLLQLAGVTAYTAFFFLPAMHERYDYLPIILVTLYYAYYHRERLWIPGVLVLVTSVMYSEYLFGGGELPGEVYALLSIAAYFFMLRDLLNALNRPDRRTADTATAPHNCAPAAPGDADTTGQHGESLESSADTTGQHRESAEQCGREGGRNVHKDQ